MSLQLVAVGPGQPELKEYEEKRPGTGEVRIRSTLSAEKHGTNLQMYRDQSDISVSSPNVFDEELRIFVPADSDRGWRPRWPMSLGNMTVGVVEEVGAEVQSLKVGDRVYGYLPIRETHTVPERAVHLAPQGLSDEALVCIDPAVVALTGIREGHVRLGDAVAIFGMGAIGLMAVQMAKLSGALTVLAIEPLQIRAELATWYGADLVIDPRADQDVGWKIRTMTEMKGVDISLETSGSYSALHHAIRGTRYGGTIVPVAWYHGGAAELRLGEEWHFNRQTMVSGARLESVPYRDYPLWDPDRVEQTVLQLLELSKLRIDGMLQPQAPIREAAEAYRRIDEHPEECVKLAVTYPEGQP